MANLLPSCSLFFFNDTATTEIYTLPYTTLFRSVAVRDAVIQQRDSDLAIATFGRSFYVLDDMSPLRTLNRQMLQQEANLFPVRDALLYIQSQRIGGRNQGFLGDTFFVAPNTPYGATFSYYLKDKYKT